MFNKLDFLFALGRPLSPLYGWLMTMRASFYKRRFFKRHTLPVPIISIGNLTMGGSGKTPIVLFLARHLQDNGWNPAIISRGYGGKANKKFNIVSKRTEILLSPEDAGDEPFMLASNLPGVPVITGKSRINPCKYALHELKADVLLLDDGFQHLSINRDIDLVLFNATTLAGNSRVFPGGVLREPVKALARCDAFMLTGVNEKNRERAREFSILLKKRFPEKQIFLSRISKHCIWSVDNQETVDNIPALGEVSAFCSIANPVRFQDSIKMAGIKMVQFTSLRDHQQYSQNLIDKLCRKAVAVGAKSILTTEKDYVKINHFNRDLPLHVLKVKQEPDDGFNTYIFSRLNRDL